MTMTIELLYDTPTACATLVSACFAAAYAWKWLPWRKMMPVFLQSPTQHPWFLRNSREEIRIRVDTVADTLLSEYGEKIAYEKLHNEVFSHVPDWVNPELLQRGRDVFWHYALSGILLGLATFSLPMTLLCADGAHVLSCTGRFKREAPPRRLLETLIFVYNIMSDKEPLAEHGRGRQDVIKVRLLHSKVRKFLLEKHGWNTEKCGAPINQEDQAGTLLSFSYLVILYTELLIGYELPNEDKVAYHHVWRYVGWALGIPEELLTADYKDDFAYAQAIFGRNVTFDVATNRTETSIALQSLLRALSSKELGLLYYVPSNLWAASFRLAVGDEIADFAGVSNFALLDCFWILHLKFIARLVDCMISLVALVWYSDPNTVTMVVQEIVRSLLCVTKPQTKLSYELTIKRSRRSLLDGAGVRGSFKKMLRTRRSKLSRSTRRLFRDLEE